jgi:hypothetical protein
VYYIAYFADLLQVQQSEVRDTSLGCGLLSRSVTAKVMIMFQVAW